MKVYGLIGYPLEHSFSAGYFNEKFMSYGLEDCQYLNFPLESIEQFPDLITRQPGLHGLNVTVPYKRQVLPYLDALSEEAKAIGAVNTICFTSTGLKGCNTDWMGFRDSLLGYSDRLSNQLALILGTGGSARAVKYALDHLGIHSQFVSRSKSAPDIMTYAELTADVIAAHHLIVQTTPVGMFPDIDACPPINFQGVGPSHLLYDLIYNPATTEFLKRSKLCGATIVNGSAMLRLQAEFSWLMWQEEGGEAEG